MGSIFSATFTGILFPIKGWNTAYESMQTWIRFVPYWQIPLGRAWGCFEITY